MKKNRDTMRTNRRNHQPPYRPILHLTELRRPASWPRQEHSHERETSARGPLARDAQVAAVEAVLFLADEPLPPRRLAQAAGLADSHEARRLVRRLRSLYDADRSPFQVEEIAGGFQLLTRPEVHPWLARWRQAGGDTRLSPAARETLAIIAYRQPIMRADIEHLRGVQCGELLRTLMERGLIRIVGRHRSLGRPVLYGTTRKFLQIFGLKSLDELPLAQQLRQPAAAETALRDVETNE
jgi:segregation and condensation protein B